MNKCLSLWLLSFTLLFSTTSCNNDSDIVASFGNPDDNPKTEEVIPVEKTIFMYLPWTASKVSTSGSLRDFFEDNINSIATGIINDGGLKNSRLIIFLVDSVNPTKEKALLMEMKYKNGKCYREIIETFTESNMPVYTSTSGLTSILSKVKTIAPAQEYAMIIGCHGLGWLRASQPSRARTRYFGGTSLAYQMDTPDFAQALSNADMKMQYILFDDCYMSTIEVAYDLRHVTDYLMACTSEIMAIGMPYSEMWSELAKKEPDYQALNQAFIDFYKSYKYPYAAFGITNCAYVDDMAETMKKINAAHTFNLADTTNVQKLDGFRSTVFYDMGSYVQQLCSDATLYNEFTAVMQKLVPYKSNTPQIYTAYKELPSPYIHVTTFSGITISDPTVSRYHSAVTSKTTTDWWKASH